MFRRIVEATDPVFVVLASTVIGGCLLVGFLLSLAFPLDGEAMSFRPAPAIAAPVKSSAVDVKRVHTVRIINPHATIEPPPWVELATLTRAEDFRVMWPATNEPSAVFHLLPHEWWTPTDPIIVPVPIPAQRRKDHAEQALACLKPQARALFDRIEQQFGEMRVVSTCRPGAVVAGSGHPSRHRYGLAIDLEAGTRKGDVVAWLIKNHKAGGTMTYGDSSHVHVDIGPHFVSLAGERRQRRPARVSTATAPVAYRWKQDAN